jgi:hypothetical protein
MPTGRMHTCHVRFQKIIHDDCAIHELFGRIRFYRLSLFQRRKFRCYLLLPKSKSLEECANAFRMLLIFSNSV